MTEANPGPDNIKPEPAVEQPVPDAAVVPASASAVQRTTLKALSISRRTYVILAACIVVLLIAAYFLTVPFLAFAYRNFDATDSAVEYAARNLPLDMVGKGLLKEKSELIHVLGERGKEALPYLVTALKHPNPYLKASAAMGIYKLGADGREALPDLIQAIVDPNAYARLSVILALGRLGPDAVTAVPAVVPALRDPDAHVRMQAAYTLGLIGDPEAAPAIQVAVGLEPRKLNITYMQKAYLKLTGQQLRTDPEKAAIDRQTVH